MLTCSLFTVSAPAHGEDVMHTWAQINFDNSMAYVEIKTHINSNESTKSICSKSSDYVKRLEAGLGREVYRLEMGHYDGVEVCSAYIVATPKEELSHALIYGAEIIVEDNIVKIIGVTDPAYTGEIEYTIRFQNVETISYFGGEMERYTSVFTAKNEDFEVVASMTPYDPDAIPARGDLTSSTPRFYRLLQSFYRLLWSVDLMQVLTMLLALILIVGVIAIFACVKACFVKSVTSNEGLGPAAMPADANSGLPQKAPSPSENAGNAPPECR
ncbi:MAG: hypothetical protein KH264_04310 [Actinomyces graevenitzii]|nr:hypothetical protein [Actinomyces graevenitzii]